MTHLRIFRSPIVVLTLVVTVSVAILTGAHLLTEPRIQAAETKRLRDTLSLLFPELDRYVEHPTGDSYEILDDEQIIGTATRIEAVGYGGPLTVLLGLKLDGSVRGVQVLSHQETPGLGARISEASFLDQFIGLRVEQIALGRNGGRIDAITSATISSAAITSRIRQAILEQQSAGETP